ncbi:histidine phosphatase superfamily [Schizothecium vesticola]|uniref:Histidine phosphatase superfamily n=1 Tax=Schizothecium vesticola TaxID=314040 RepID=A0AA40KCG4_9PEZI|nr:histidine phosphatase superfamily [Schizothecium vesticola]
MACRYKFSVVPGYFIDNVAAAKDCPGSKLTTRPNLGLVERLYESDDAASAPKSSWVRFCQHVETLNRDSAPGESFKILFITRHGLSVHNAVMERVGNAAWNIHWSHLEGDGNLSWVDAKLTRDGIRLAQSLGELWFNWVESSGIPLPGRIYTSPLARCLETTKLVYSAVMTEHGDEFRPIVKELLRERLTDHTCDKRSSRSWIAENYPNFVLEEGFAEADDLWRADRCETNAQHVARKQQLLEDIFTNDASYFISLTTHSYAISSILEATGAPHFRVCEGAIFPLFVKGARLERR